MYPSDLRDGRYQFPCTTSLAQYIRKMFVSSAYECQEVPCCTVSGHTKAINAPEELRLQADVLVEGEVARHRHQEHVQLRRLCSYPWRFLGMWIGIPRTCSVLEGASRLMAISYKLESSMVFGERLNLGGGRGFAFRASLKRPGSAVVDGATKPNLFAKHRHSPQLDQRRWHYLQWPAHVLNPSRTLEALPGKWHRLCLYQFTR